MKCTLLVKATAYIRALQKPFQSGKYAHLKVVKLNEYLSDISLHLTK